MKNKQTITEALGLPDSWIEESREKLIEIWNANERISDALERIGESIKVEEFDCEIPLSIYEKKLILSGWILGRETANGEISSKMKFLELLMKGMEAQREEDEEEED